MQLPLAGRGGDPNSSLQISAVPSSHPSHTLTQKQKVQPLVFAGSVFHLVFISGPPSASLLFPHSLSLSITVRVIAHSTRRTCTYSRIHCGSAAEVEFIISVTVFKFGRCTKGYDGRNLFLQSVIIAWRQSIICFLAEEWMSLNLTFSDLRFSFRHSLVGSFLLSAIFGDFVIVTGKQ